MSTPSEGFSVIVGLNPALQKRFILSDKTPNLIPGNVHRASSMQQGIGGKGQDVAVTLACLFTKMNHIYLAQLVGSGAEGDLALSKLNQALNVDGNGISSGTARTTGQISVDENSREDSKHAWRSLTVRTKAALRTCTTIVSNDSATELVEPSGTILPNEIKLLKDKIDDISSTNIRGLCIMGSMPPGCEANLYAELYGKITENCPNILSVIDTVVGLDHLFQQIKTSRTPGSKCMLKINFAEFCRLAKMNNSSSSSESSSTSLEHIKSALHGFFDTFSDAKDALDFIAITNGCHPAHLVCLQKGAGDVRIFSLEVPDLSIIQDEDFSKVYPIGAGDSVAGGTLAAWEYLHASNDAVQEQERLDISIQHALKEKCDCGSSENIAATALAYGIACGSASCVKEENSVLEIKDSLELLKHVKVQQIS